MRTREFVPATMRVHLPIAKVAGLMVLPVIATGIWLLRSERGRRWHRLAVVVFLLATVAATATGINAYAFSTPK
jgi:type IV secretory pathway VirB2 component (pilin)